MDLGTTREMREEIRFFFEKIILSKDGLQAFLEFIAQEP
jgi:hypothetical protein